MNQKIVSLLPNFYSLNGHDFNYHSLIQKMAQELGLSFEAYIPHECKVHKLPPEWKRIFKTRLRKLYPVHFFQSFLAFTKILRSKEPSRRYFFIDAYILEVAGFAWASCFFSKKKDHVWVFLRYGLPLLKKRRVIHWLSIKCLKMIWGKRIVFLTDSERIGNSFPVKFVLVPHPHRQIIGKMTENPVCFWRGNGAPEKGFHEIKRLLKLPEKAGFQLLLPRRKDFEGTNVIHFNDDLSQSEYEELFSSCSVVLLPYDAKWFRYATSGIFVEAVSTGKMPLVKEGSWLAGELKKHHLSELIVDWDNPHFFSHLATLQKDVHVLEKLKKMQMAYLEFHSLKTFKAKIEELLT